MIKLYRKNYDYELKTTKECLIGKLRNSTFQGLFNYYKHILFTEKFLKKILK